MENSPTTSPENAITIRELGIHVANMNVTLKEMKETEKRHHDDNVSRNEALLKKLEEMKDNYPTRTEFNDYKASQKETINALWKQKASSTSFKLVQSILFGLIGLILTGVVLAWLGGIISVPGRGAL